MTNQQNQQPQKWHKVFGEGFEKFLSGVDILVLTEVPVMSKSPEVDILLLRRNEPAWTTEQLKRLPDGIRQSKASHILLEFKYTESINRKAFLQAITYDYLYKEAKNLSEQEVQTFVVSAQKPQPRTRKKWGYNETMHKGVYQNQEGFLKEIPLISINELSDKPHNAFIKCFATHRAEREKAFDILGQEALPLITEPVEMYLIGLWQWFEKGDIMDIELTPQDIMALGQKFGQTYLSTLSLEKRLAGTAPCEVMNRFRLGDRLAGINPTDVITHLKPKPGEILAGLSPNEIDELEIHLKNFKQQKKD